MSNEALERLVVKTSTSGIKVLDTMAVLDGMESEIWGEVGPFSDEGPARFRKWCEDNSVTYYARPREDFSVAEAFELAAKSGREYLVMEDLS